MLYCIWRYHILFQNNAVINDLQEIGQLVWVEIELYVGIILLINSAFGGILVHYPGWV